MLARRIGDSQPLANFSDKSMMRGEVSNNDLAFGWCQWLLQGGYTFIEVEVIEFLFCEVERVWTL